MTSEQTLVIVSIIVIAVTAIGILILLKHLEKLMGEYETLKKDFDQQLIKYHNSFENEAGKIGELTISSRTYIDTTIESIRGLETSELMEISKNIETVLFERNFQ